MAAFRLWTLDSVEVTSCYISDFCGVCGAIGRRMKSEVLIECSGMGRD